MKSETGVKDFSRAHPPASLVFLFKGSFCHYDSAGRCGHRSYKCKKSYSPAKLHTNSNAHVNSFTTAGMVSMDTSVVTAKMWEA